MSSNDYFLAEYEILGSFPRVTRIVEFVSADPSEEGKEDVAKKNKQGKELSASALELYEAMKTGVTCQYLYPLKGKKAFYWRSDTLRKCTKQAVALLDAGLVEYDENILMGHRIRIKRSGEDYVERQGELAQVDEFIKETENG
jgi:hypothetical protein